MTNHVVADGILGLVARKQWEIQRRIMEGSLDPWITANRLQSVIENLPNAFEIEAPDYTISTLHYTVPVTTGGDVVALSRSVFQFNDWDNYASNVDFHRFPGRKPPKSGKAKLYLAQLKNKTHPNMLAIQAQARGETLADGWDLISFIEHSLMPRTIRDQIKICAIGGSRVTGHWKNEERTPVSGYLYAESEYKRQSSEKTRWSLRIEGVPSHDHFDVDKGDYILLRAKQ